MVKFIHVYRELNSYKRTFNFRVMWYHFVEKVMTKLAKLPFPFLRPIVSRGFKAKHRAILSYLENDFSEFLEDYDFETKQKDNQISTPKQIFALWFQGKEAAPPLVRATLDSQVEFAERHAYEYIFLTQENLTHYFKVPEALQEKVQRQEIDYIKLSDLIRCSLLADYGGIWFDSTLYVGTEEDAAYLEAPFYTIPARGKEWYPKYVANNRWAMFCIAGSKGNIIFRYLRDIQIAYYSKYSKPIDYFLIDYLLDIGYRRSSEIRRQIDAVPRNNQNLYHIANHINDCVDEAEWNEVRQNTQLFKCSYKIKELVPGDTYYQQLLNGSLGSYKRGV